MIFQIAEVTKPLGSVKAMTHAGNRVFQRSNSYIENAATGAKTSVKERSGAHVFDVWVPRVNEVNPRDAVHGNDSKKGNPYTGRYQALTPMENEEGFIRQNKEKVSGCVGSSVKSVQSRRGGGPGG